MNRFFPAFLPVKVYIILILIGASEGLVCAQVPLLDFGDQEGYFYNCNYSDATPQFSFTLENNTSEAERNRISNYHIVWGDGQEADFQNENFPLNHDYSQGSFSLEITVTYDGTQEHSVSFTVYNTKPSCSTGRISGQSACAPQTWEFLLSGYEANPPITLYYWNFGDGTTRLWNLDSIEANNARITHVYSKTSCRPDAEIPTEYFSAGAQAILLCANDSYVEGNGELFFPIRISSGPEAKYHLDTGDVQEDALNDFTGCVDQTIFEVKDKTVKGTYSFNCDTTSNNYEWKVLLQNGDVVIEADPSTYEYFSGNVNSEEPSFLFRAIGMYYIELSVSNQCNEDNPSTYRSGAITIYDITSLVYTDYSPKHFCLESNPVVAFSSNDPEEGTLAETTFSWWGVIEDKNGVQITAMEGVDYQFVDETNRESKNPHFNFLRPGLFQVKLIKENVCGTSPTFEFPVEVYDRPQADILDPDGVDGNGRCGSYTYSPRAVYTDNGAETFGFSSNQIVEYLWTFDNNGEVTTSDQAVPGDVTFSNVGPCSVTLKVQNDSCGWSTEDRIDFEIYDVPTASFTRSDESCEQVPITYEASPNGMARYLWTFGDGATAEEQNPEHTFGSPGEKSDMMIVESAQGCRDTAVQTLQVKAWPSVEAGPDAAICDQDNSYSLGGTSAENYSALLWTTNGDGSFDVDNSLTPTYTVGAGDVALGKVLLTLTASGEAPCGEAQDSMVLTITPAPVIQLQNGEDQICQGTSYSISGTVVQNHQSLNWSSNQGGVFSNAASLNPVYTPPSGFSGTVELTLTAKAFGVCADAQRTINLQVNPRPEAEAGANALICEGSQLQLAGTASNTSSIQWSSSGNGVFDEATILNPVYTPGDQDIENGTVTLTLHGIAAAPCEDVSDELVLTIQKQPTVEAGADGKICSNDVGFEVESGVGGGKAYAENYSSLEWSSSGSGSFDQPGNLNTFYAPSEADRNQGFVILTLKADALVPCSDAVQDQMRLDIVPQPQVEGGEDATLCQGESYALAGSAANSAGVQWTSSGEGTFDDSASLTATYTPAPGETGNIRLTLQAAPNEPCAAVEDELILTYIPFPEAHAGADNEVCEDGVFSIPAGGGPEQAHVYSADSLHWETLGDGSFDNPQQIDAKYTPGETDRATGVVTLRLIAYAKAPCTGSHQDEMELTITPIPTANAGGNAAICQGDDFPITAASATEYSSVTWSTSSADGYFEGVNTLIPIYHPGEGETGEITLTLTANGKGTCASRTDDMILEITPAPVANSGTDVRICEDRFYTVSGASVDNESGFSWTTSGLGILSDETTLSPTYTAAPGETGDVYLKLTVQGNGSCLPVADSMKITIVPHPTLDAGDDGEVCSNEVYHMNVGDGDGQVRAGSWSSIEYSTSGDGFFTDQEGLVATYVPGENDKVNGSVELSIRANGIDPCNEFVTDKMTLVITPEPKANAGENASLCEGENFEVTASSSSEYSALNWSASEGGTFSDPTILHPLYTPSEGKTGLVVLELTVQGNGSCQPAVDKMDLDIVPLPAVNAGPDAMICEGKDFVVEGAEATSYASVNWVSSGSGTFEDNAALKARYIPSEDDLIQGMVQLKVTVQGVSPCVVSASDEMVLSFTPPPVVDAGRRDTVCQETGNYAVKTKSEAYEWGADTLHIASMEWSTNGNGVLENAHSLTPTYRIAAGEHGTIQLVLTGYGNANCDPVLDTLDLTILPTPVPDFSFGKSCMKNPVSFLDKSSGEGFDLTKWQWDLGDGNSSANTNPIHVYDTAGTYPVTLEVSNFWGCTSRIQRSVEVQPLPIVRFEHEEIVAARREVEFINETENGDQYFWLFGDGDFSNLVDPVHIYQEPGDYVVRLRAESAYGCVDSAQSNLVAIDAPLAGFTKSPDGCGPLQVTFSDASQGKYLTYHWDFGNGQESTESQPDPVVFAQGVLDDTTYTVRLRVTNIAGTSEFSDVVTVHPVPIPDFEILPNAYGCSPVSKEIFNTSKGKPDHYIFDFGDGTSAEYDKPNVERPFTHGYTTGEEKTIYHVRLTASNACGVREIEKELTVFPNSAVAVFRSDQTEGCAPLTVEFDNLSVGAGDHLESDWVFEEGLAPVREIPGVPVSHTYQNGGTYQVMLVVHDTCAYDTTYRKIVVHDPATIGFETDARGYCEQEAVWFVVPANTAKNFNQWSWDFGDESGSEDFNPSHSYDEAGTYLVGLTGIDVAHGCPNSVEKEITIQEKPVADFSVSDSVGCEPFDVRFMNQSKNAEFYTWDFRDGATSSLGDPQHKFSAGSYRVQMVAESFYGCLDTAYQNVFSRPTPQANFEMDASVGCGVPYYLKVLNTTEDKLAKTYGWDFGNGTQSHWIDPDLVLYKAYGNYSIRLVAFNQYLCSDTITRKLEIFHIPEIGFEVDRTSLCEGEEVHFTDTSRYGNKSYWDFGDGSRVQEQEATHSYFSSGKYSLGLRVVGEGGCADSITLEDYLSVYPLPRSEFSYQNINTPPDGVELPEGEVPPNNGYVQFTNQSEVGVHWDWITDNSLTFLWDFRDNSFSEELHPLHRYSNNGSFQVRLTTTSAYGCQDSVTHKVEVDLMSSLYIPSAFAPENANEQVSRFIPKGIGLFEYHIEVYDTWGNMVWESEEIENGRPVESWGGDFQGRLLPQGTYIWQARAVFLNGAIWKGMRIGNKYYRQGTVTLIR